MIGQEQKKVRKVELQTIIKWAGSGLTLILFFYILEKQDWQKIWQIIRTISGPLLAVVWLIYFAKNLLSGLRWFILLKIAKIQIPLSDSLKLFFSGMFISNFLPSTIGGDGLRFFALLRFENDKTRAFSSIVGDRLINIAGMISLLPISMIVFFDRIRMFWETGIAGAAMLINLGKRAESWKSSLRSFISKNEFWFQSPQKLFSSLVVTWLAQSVYFLGHWLIARNLGMSIGYFQVFGISILTYLVTMLPFSINGYGLREVTLTSLYASLGYPIDAAVSLAIITRLLYLSTTLIGAAWLPQYLSYLGKKIPEI